jgi:glutamate 5-kinase
MGFDKKRMVVKVGTSTLIYNNGKINLRRISELAKVLCDITNSGHEVVLVSSGAIGMGLSKLGIDERPENTACRQAISTVGQCELMFMYDKLFGEYNYSVGQLLITKEDVDNDQRRQNLINAFNKLFELNVIPIVNENDCVAVEEIVYGDNDCLSAIVARLVEADLLVMLTDRDGLFDSNPSHNPDAKLISVVEEITPVIEKIAEGSSSKMGTGGMITKVQAARIATSAGIPTYIVNGNNLENVYRALENKEVGTIFKAVK